MKTRRWTLLALTGLLLAWATSAFAAASGSPDDPSRVLRQYNARGAVLEVNVLDPKGRPVSGANIVARASDLTSITAVTNSSGTAVLDGLPEMSSGTLQATKNLRAVNWNCILEPGKLNHLTIKYDVLCYGIYPRKYRTPLRVKLFTEQPIFDRRWEPVHYSSSLWPWDKPWPIEKTKGWPVRGRKTIDNNWVELTYLPMDNVGQITQAYFRPWGMWEGAAPMTLSTWWHLSVYTYVNCDRKNQPSEMNPGE